METLAGGSGKSRPGVRGAWGYERPSVGQGKSLLGGESNCDKHTAGRGTGCRPGGLSPTKKGPEETGQVSGAQIPRGLVGQGGRFGLCPLTHGPPGGGAENADTGEKGRSQTDAEGEARSNAGVTWDPAATSLAGKTKACPCTLYLTVKEKWGQRQRII